MKKRLGSILVVIAMLIVCIFTGMNASDDAQASDPEPVCTVQVSNVVCVLAGVTILNQPIALPTIKVPGPTITLPPIKVTDIVHVPGPTQTVTVPGGTQTITAPPVTTTVTAHPTNGPSALPTATVTVGGGLAPATTTVTVDTGQDDTPSGTLDPSGDGSTTTKIVKVTGVGLGIIALLAVLIVLGMYGGYYIGYRDSDKAEANFFRALLNKE